MRIKIKKLKVQSDHQGCCLFYQRKLGIVEWCNETIFDPSQIGVLTIKYGDSSQPRIGV